MTRKIDSVAVIGGGTMGSGIAAASAAAGHPVLLIESDEAAAAKARDRVLAAATDDAERHAINNRLTVATSLDGIGAYDWICEAIIEDLAAKRALLSRVEGLRKDGSVVSTNTSGIPLSTITADLPQRLRRDIAVTHFFNPVRVMRLLEIVPDTETSADTVTALADFGRHTLGKGIVHAKDTVNFIANRIGCFWMLAGLHKAIPHLEQGLGVEDIDAILSAPVGLPNTGLFGLIDLIGLDVMNYVGANLARNLPAGDAGLAFTAFPAEVQALLDNRQLGRKTGGGFYRVVKQADGGKTKEAFDLLGREWRPLRPVTPPRVDLLADDGNGRLAWDLLGETLLYAADLVPQIADDIVNIDRALRWGFAWQRGPFEFLDDLGPHKVIAKLKAQGRPLPAMLAVLEQAGADSFYAGDAFLGRDGGWHAIPTE